MFPTPWSLAMFVLELSKQSGVCLARAFERRAPRRLPDLLALRHRLAHHEHRRRPRPPAPGARARRCSPSCTTRVDDADARFTLEVRRSNGVAIHLYEREGFRAAGMRRRYYQDNGEDALVMWRTPATLRGLARRRAQPRAGSMSDPRARDELRRHLRRGRSTTTGASLSNVISSQARARALRRRRARDRLAPPPRARQRDRRARRSREAGVDARRRRAGRRHAGPGPRRRAARRAVAPARRSPRRASCRSRRSTTCRATSPPTSCADDARQARSSRRSCA